MMQPTTGSAGWARLVALCALVSACGGSDNPAPAPVPSPTPNAPPTATISAGATGTVGTAMTLNATATDSDGNVSMVQFLDGTTVLGQDTTAPYSFSWTPTFTGAHSLTARATDNAGAITTSAAVTVTVSTSGGTDTQPPVVAVGNPLAFATNLAGAINFSASATDNVGVANVEFQIDGTALVTNASTPPAYSATIDSNAFASGQHVLRVRAIDAAGNQSAWSSVTVQFGGSRTQPAGFTRNEAFVTGLSNATQFAQAPDGRLFVSQQGGAMSVVKNGAVSTFMSLTVDSSGERGLLGVAFHPNLASNNLVYAYYTVPGSPAHNRISRFTANGDVVMAGSEQVLVDLPALSSATNHNGGAIHFGLDGKLYVGVGENANSANSQNLATPLGKFLRFNDDGSIPPDNPNFNSQSGLARAVWASGLRNPFTFAVQPGTGRIHINDVGEVTWEEINLAAKGANYGWPGSEGPTGVTGNITGPLFTSKHSAAAPPGSGPGGFFVGNVIAGGTFYPYAGSFPVQYQGNYFFADSGATFIGMLDLANDNAAYSFGKVSGNPVDMLVSNVDGTLLVLTRSNIARFSTP
ncbi:MAG TPA: PQQ-dependent sugar dehydrogenase [Burkholderiaceae bacterium]